MKIFKYYITADRYQTIEIPVGFRLLSVQNQNEQICIWALVDNSKPLKTLAVECFTTGQECKPISLDGYLGTVQLDGGNFVTHVFTYPE